MNVILLSVKWKSALVYLDNTDVFSKTVWEHITYLRQVLTLLRDANVTVKFRKCPFFAKNINYLDHVIRRRRLKIAKTTTKAILELQDPTT